MVEEIVYRVLIYSLMVSLSLVFLSLSRYLWRRINLNKRQLDLKQYEIDTTSTIQDDVFTLLDKIIQECFAEYTILNIEYRNDIEYINSELEDLITREVSHKVIDRISPLLITKISMVYNIANFDKLLSERVYLATMNYSITKNSAKNKKE